MTVCKASFRNNDKADLITKEMKLWRMEGVSQ